MMIRCGHSCIIFFPAIRLILHSLVSPSSSPAFGLESSSPGCGPHSGRGLLKQLGHNGNIRGGLPTLYRQSSNLQPSTGQCLLYHAFSSATVLFKRGRPTLFLFLSLFTTVITLAADGGDASRHLETSAQLCYGWMTFQHPKLHDTWSPHSLYQDRAPNKVCPTKTIRPYIIRFIIFIACCRVCGSHGGDIHHILAEVFVLVYSIVDILVYFLFLLDLVDGDK